MSPYKRAHSGWRTRLGKVLSFSLEDWGVFFEAVGTLLSAKTLLYFVEFPKLLARMTRVQPASGSAWPRARVERTAWLVDVAGRATGLSCLPRSLALARVLGRRGITTEVRIGVQTTEGKLAAHAWVEWSGRALNEYPSRLHSFVPFEGLTAFRGETSHV